MPFIETAILLLSSRYSRIIFKVLWLTCFGIFFFSSAMVMMLPSIFFRVSSTIRTVFRVGECSSLGIVCGILILVCYYLINIRYQLVYKGFCFLMEKSCITIFLRFTLFRLPFLSKRSQKVSYMFVSVASVLLFFVCAELR